VLKGPDVRLIRAPGCNEVRPRPELTKLLRMASGSRDLYIGMQVNRMSYLNSPLRSLVELDPETSLPSALPDHIYTVLKHRVLKCVLQPGQRVTEKQLSAELGVSRTPLREALNRLSLEGLITMMPYRGYIVAPLTVENIRNLCEVRRIVESEAAGLAARRATPPEIDRLVQLARLDYKAGQSQTYEGYLRANSEFHLALVQCTHNPPLEGIVMSVLDRLQRPLYLELDVMDSETATKEHLDLVRAVKNRDARRARKLMQDQIIGTEHRLVEIVKAAGF
jgi:DNA-binding GntR family transcriptional regulator